MSALTFQDFLNSIQRKWQEFMEDEGHANFPFRTLPSNSEETEGDSREDREKFEEFLANQNNEYKKMGCNEVPVIIQKLKAG